ncbi:MAG: alpha/beta fold hydrolase [Chitinophagaceae bacterium]
MSAGDKNWLPFRYSLRQNKVVPQHTDDIEKLQNFKPAVLLVKGTGSASFLHAAIDLKAKDIPRGTVIELPEGHAPHIVSKKEFLKVVKDFVQQMP